jgi:hypothetical protein
MAPNPAIMQAVEKLGYRVTIGDVAAQAGLNVELASQGLLALAADAGGNMQVSNSGDIVYLFPKNFRDVLRNKYFQIKLQEWWQKIWGALFYLIRLSFGIFLIASMVLISVTLIAISIAATFNSDNNDSGGSGDGGNWGNFFFFPDFWWYTSPNYGNEYEKRQREKKELNFFEAVFSFLFGDGNPNAKLEEKRWKQIGAVIRSNRGAVVAEQISPYLDNIGETYQQEYEDYMLPVLIRFDGKPEVSPEGQLVYYFPKLQVGAKKRLKQRFSAFLEEIPFKFSAATSGQLYLSAGLGILNLGGALVLGSLLKGGALAAQLGGLVAFVQSIYWVLLIYGIGFISVPLVRYFWIKWRNTKIVARNRDRISRAKLLASANPDLQAKIAYASEFASETIITRKDLAYSTETDLLDQEFKSLEAGDDDFDSDEEDNLNNS